MQTYVEIRTATFLKCIIQIISGSFGLSMSFQKLLTLLKHNEGKENIENILISVRLGIMIIQFAVQLTNPKDLFNKIQNKKCGYFLNHFTSRKCYIKRISQLFLIPTIPQEIREIIKRLPMKHYTGIDEISNKVVKVIDYIISYRVSEIANERLLTGIYPNAF